MFIWAALLVIYFVSHITYICAIYDRRTVPINLLISYHACMLASKKHMNICTVCIALCCLVSLVCEKIEKERLYMCDYY